MVSAVDIAWMKEDKISIAILKFISNKQGNGSHLNELSRELPTGSRVTILDRLTKLEDSNILNSQMEFSQYGEKKVQKWTRKYRISPEYKELLKKTPSL